MEASQWLTAFEVRLQNLPWARPWRTALGSTLPWPMIGECRFEISDLDRLLVVPGEERHTDEARVTRLQHAQADHQVSVDFGDTA